MSLKITSATGFKIGKVLNPGITEIYVRPKVSMKTGDQKPITDSEGNITHISIYTEAAVTTTGGTFDQTIQVDYIYPVYWTQYSTSVTDMNVLYFEIETWLKNKFIEDNPEWSESIEIVNLGPL